MTIQILEQTTDYIVCVKPAGLAVQTGKASEQDMESLLMNMLRKDVYVIHRLDQPVEGITVWAFNRKKAAFLSSLVSGNKMTKKYLAYIKTDISHPIPDEGELKDHIKKEGKGNVSVIVSDRDPDGKLSLLKYKVINRGSELTLVEIELITGRHHQIRLQFAHAGWPLAGDRKYGNPGDDKSSGLCLCAYKLEYMDEDGSLKKYEIRPSWI